MLANRYQLGKELGAGGMGTVYLGTDSHNQHPVAIKHLKNDTLEPELLERFRREGEALRELNHPNIVKLLDAFAEADQHYLVMEYVEGGDLNRLLDAGKIPLEQVLRLSIDLADALTRAHKLDIIHRDLKPANVLIGSDGVLRLSDFGIAHIQHKSQITQTDTTVGTINYIAPEYLNGELPTSKVDIWAFGVMLFQMLTGQYPFAGEILTELLLGILVNPLPDLEALAPDAPTGLVDLVYRMMERDPQARISSVRYVGAELEDILQGRMNTPPASRFVTPVPDFIQRPRHNLPAQTTEFVGREAELRELANMLSDSKVRLITIVAQGGMGKTRLSLELARHYIFPHQAEASGMGFKDGVYFVELAPLVDSSNIVAAIAQATSYQFQADGREQKQQVLDFLGNKNLLLVLDNYEHLLEGAGLVTEILKAAPNVKILATSRQRLNQLSETIFNLQGMDFPAWETPADALEYAAVKLFMQSAKRARPDFEVTAENMDAIARICKLVQGMPLGIVMAAAWMGMLSAEEIATEIAQSIDFLTSDMGEIPDRQRSMRMIFDYSWDLMTDAEQQVFMKLAVFRGGFSRQAGQAITGATLQQLMSLVNKSLLRRDSDSGRYEIHELLRQYAAEKAEQAGVSEAAHETHTTHYANMLYERESHLKGHRQLEAYNDIEGNFENVRTAWVWAVEHGYEEAIGQMLEVLSTYCNDRSRYQEAVILFEVARQQLADSQKTTTLQGQLLTCLGWMQLGLGDNQKASQLAEQGLHITRQHNDRREIAKALLILGYASPPLGKIQEAQVLTEEALALCREIGDKYNEGRILQMMAYLAATHLGQYEQGELLLHEALNIRREIGDRVGTATALMNLGVSEATLHRRYDRAEAYYREALTIKREMRLWEGMLAVLNNLASLFLIQARLNEADEAAREALLVAREANYRFGLMSSLGLMSTVQCWKSDYTAALNYLDEADALVQPHDTPDISGSLNVSRSFVLCSQGNYAAAEKLFRVGLPTLVVGLQVTPLLDLVFLYSVILAFHHQQHLRALKLVSLIIHHPVGNWLSNDPLAMRLTVHLQQSLPADVYAAAWEAGKSLDLDTVVKEIVAECEQDSNQII